MPDYTFGPLASLDEVAALRRARLETLSATPELFVELVLRSARPWEILCDGARVGYLATQERAAIQLGLVPEHRTHADRALLQAREALGLERAWASTYDPLALCAALSLGRGCEVLGLQFRTLGAPGSPPTAPLPAVRLATLEDLPVVQAINHPEVFDDPDDIPVWLEAGWVTLFSLGSAPVGLGLCTPTGPGIPSADVGVLVVPEHQGRGLGSWIVGQMAERARSRGLTPTAGCAVDNAASRATLERAGFVADHRLLSVDLRTG